MNDSGNVVIRPYQEEDEAEWMRVHAIILSISHAWNYSIQDRPVYEGYASSRLVAEVDGRIAGLADVQFENEPGELCFLKDSRGGYVLEFGRLPEYAGRRIGQRLIDAMTEDAKAEDVRRLEFWTQDRSAQRYYQRLRMKEIGRHYRFRIKPPEGLHQVLDPQKVAVEYLYCACLPEEWPRIREQYEVVEKHPLEPHLCIGYEIRF